MFYWWIRQWMADFIIIIVFNFIMTEAITWVKTWVIIMNTLKLDVL